MVGEENEKLFVSSIGIGTHFGNLEKETDLEMFNSIVESSIFLVLNPRN